MWVKGHDGVEANEKADRRAKEEVRMGERMHKPDIVTPAGIRQKYRPHGTTPGHLKWSGMAIRGLTYMVTDKGPQAYWLKEIGKAEVGSCVCDKWTQQNAAHLSIEYAVRSVYRIISARWLYCSQYNGRERLHLIFRGEGESFYSKTEIIEERNKDRKT